MGKKAYEYTFVKSGTGADSQKSGMDRKDALKNAQNAANREQHTQDILRRRVDSNDPWEKHCTVAAKVDEKVQKAQVIAKECIQAIEEAMPKEDTVRRIQVMHLRREGMREAVEAVKRHFYIA